MIRSMLALLLAASLSACATTDARTAKADHPEARAYTTTADTDAMADVDAALVAAKASGKHVLIAMGANWCHDSRALAGWLETPRFVALMAEHYEVVFVNAGMPQTGDFNNLDVAQRFGIETLEGTPTLMIVSADGTLLNRETAKTWRNTASRSEDAIFKELALLANTEARVAKPRGEVAEEIWVGSFEQSCRYSSTEDGPWRASLDELGKIGPTTRIAGATGETSWHCIANAIAVITDNGGSVGFISNPSELIDSP